MATSDSTTVYTSTVTGKTAAGTKFSAPLKRLAHCRAVFELYDQSVTLRMSEVLPELSVTMNGCEVYLGRGVVSGFVNVGTGLLCEIKLDEASFVLTAPSGAQSRHFSEFLREWQKVYRVLPQFKVAVADIQTFLSDLKIWSEQIMLEHASADAAKSAEAETVMLKEITTSLIPAFNAMHERFEEISQQIETDARPVHQNFTQRLLHPLVMCSPFAHRTFHKPLGYAGDYEMVNMIVKNAPDGASLFAKALNNWFLDQWPAKAHRNRILHLKRRLREECARGEREGRRIKILNLGCGPAREIQEFIAEDALSDFADFTLFDFNDETINYTAEILTNAKRKFSRKTRIELTRKSVHQVLKEGSRPSAELTGKFDMVYCAGLFDYLSDRTCKQLMDVFYAWLGKDGFLLATNVHDSRPFRNMMEFLLDWHLIYRDAKKGATLLPEAANPENAHLEVDSTQVNVFIETRKS